MVEALDTLTCHHCRHELQAGHLSITNKSERIKRDPLASAITNHISFGIKVLILSICLALALGGHHPPANAESVKHTVSITSTEDAMQDERIGELNQHLQATDARVEALRQTLDQASNSLSVMQGEERSIGLLLTILSIAGIALQLVRKQA
jgi:hypothetical protein